ncbi:MAG: hypothetical protein Barrevirus12_16 [Barrevirus sp.]|uniref:Uncharacterized protein n=1 Tax=Barrevirus sp. TaxID=2487763 RepID=A0A3G4ZQF6_9VIRU|nr:MAG: hypothetical protein Barrevirus12_16 [Barrevirus sp.]
MVKDKKLDPHDLVRNKYDYQKNKVKHNTYRKCTICDGKFSDNTKTNHFRSAKHKNAERVKRIAELEKDQAEKEKYIKKLEEENLAKDKEIKILGEKLILKIKKL